MKIIEVGGARIPALGFGTWQLEGETCRSMVARAIETGYRHIDTARMYGNEREVGQGIRDSGLRREEIFLTTKVWWTDIGKNSLGASAGEALEALGVDQVDLLLIHWPNPDVPLDESIGALNEVRSSGLARHIGVANFPSAMFDEAARISEAPIVCNQVEYHPLLSQKAVHQACVRNDAAMIAYCPISRGGSLLADPALTTMAEHYGKTPAQVILRWEIEQDRVGAIPRTSKAERLKENIDIFDFELEAEDRAALDRMTERRERLVSPTFAPAWDSE